MKEWFLYATIVMVSGLLLYKTYQSLRKRYPKLTEIPEDGLDIPDSYSNHVNTFVFEGCLLEVHSFEELRVILEEAGFRVRIEEPFMLVAHVFYKGPQGKYVSTVFKYEVPGELRNSNALHEYNLCRIAVRACQAYKAEYSRIYPKLQDIDFL
jgi:hypothetical protein